MRRWTGGDHTRIWEHLNELAQGVEDEVARLEADTGWVAVTVLAPFTGTGVVRRIGHVVELTLLVTAPGTGFAPGNTENVAAIAAEFWPLNPPAGSFNARITGYLSGGHPAVGYVSPTTGRIGVSHQSGANRATAQMRGTWLGG